MGRKQKEDSRKNKYCPHVIHELDHRGVDGLSMPRRRRTSRGTWPALGGVRTTLPHGLLSRRRGVFATASALTFDGRRAILGGISATMVLMLGAVRLLPLGWAMRGRRVMRRCCSLASAAAQAEERERAVSPARSCLLTLTACTESARRLHLATATLADPFVSSESSSPHAEPAMDGRCLAATVAVILLHIRISEMNELALVFWVF